MGHYIGNYTVWFKKKGNTRDIYKTIVDATDYKDAAEQFWKDHSEDDYRICYINNYV